MEFNNKSELEFNSISSEKYRVYEWGNGVSIKITQPLFLNVSKSGGHRIFDNSGKSHYIPSGWIHLYWESYVNTPHFVK